MRGEEKAMLTDMVSKFIPDQRILNIQRHGNGHINDTYLVETDRDKYILQRINTSIFKKPEELMSNIYKITEHLKKSIRERGGDELREALTVIKTTDGRLYYQDEKGDAFRMYLFIRDAVCLEKADTPEEFYESAVAFGNFQRLLSDFDAGELYETIPDFHNTPKRYEAFEKAVMEDVAGRVKEVLPEIDFLRDRKDKLWRGRRLLEENRLPLRVTHNDTKLNNIMMDAATGKGMTIIDLDTVMPGLSIHDFGDSIRFGANTASEDERDLSLVGIDLELFEAYVNGFLEGAGGGLTDEEIDELVYGAWNMTAECGMRFLTDYLEGDKYFKIHREGHNLDRARNQFALLRSMEDCVDELTAIVERAKETVNA